MSTNIGASLFHESPFSSNFRSASTRSALRRQPRMLDQDVDRSAALDSSLSSSLTFGLKPPKPNQATEANSYLDTSFTILYLLVTVFSLVGNSLILIVLLRRKRMRRPVTNFFLANITVANLIYTVCAPIKFFVYVHKYELQLGDNVSCTLLPFLTSVSINVNTLSMVAASIERFIFIVFPFIEPIKKRKSGFIIFAIWIISIVISIPWFLIIKMTDIKVLNKKHSDSVDKLSDHEEELKKLLYDDYEDKSEMVAQNNNNNNNTIENSIDIGDEILKFKIDGLDNEMTSIRRACMPSDDVLARAYIISLSLMQYFLPLIVLILTYVIIAYFVYVINSNNQIESRSLRSTTSSGASSSTNNYSSIGGKKKKLIKFLILIIICFNVCWFPLQLYVIILAINPSIVTSQLSERSQKNLWVCVHFLAFSHFCHNPFINGFLNKRFKNELISLFKCGYSRSKAFILYKSCHWFIRNRQGQFESTSVEMNRKQMQSSCKVREKSVYQAENDKDIALVGAGAYLEDDDNYDNYDNENEYSEMFHNNDGVIRPSCLFTHQSGRLHTTDKHATSNDLNGIKKDSPSSSDKSNHAINSANHNNNNNNNKKKSSTSTTSSSSAATTGLQTLTTCDNKKKSHYIQNNNGRQANNASNNNRHLLQHPNHNLRAEAYSLGQQVSSIDSINNLKQSRAKFCSPKTIDRKRVIYSFQSSRANLAKSPSSALSPPTVIAAGLINTAAANMIYSSGNGVGVGVGSGAGCGSNSSSSSASFVTYSTRRTRSSIITDHLRTSPFLITPVGDNMCLFAPVTAATTPTTFPITSNPVTTPLSADAIYSSSSSGSGRVGMMMSDVHTNENSAAARRSKYGRKATRSVVTKPSVISLVTSNSTGSFVNIKKPANSL